MTSIRIVSILVAAVAILGLDGWSTTHGFVDSFQKDKADVVNNITQKIIDYVDPGSIREYLRNLTTKPHLAGTPQNDLLYQYVYDVWVEQGLDTVRTVSYDVLLSFPDWNNLNQVNIVNDDTEDVIFSAAGRQKPLYAAEESDPTAIPNFNAYSRPGRIKGDLVYVHYGRKEDFEWIRQQTIDLHGKIVIARYGRIFRGNIVSLAEEYNASGVIIYSDPEDFAQLGRENVYPDSIWLPGTGTQSGTLHRMSGDPQTPNYPSKDGAYRIAIEDAPIPKIPVQPISYDDAEHLLGQLGGIDSPPEWHGTLNVSYKVGPGFIDGNLTVVLDVKTNDRIVTITNVIGVIQGSIEPDRFVLLGNHRDAWVFGAIDPSSATASLLEVTRVFGLLRQEGWQPRRTIVFASWDAEEYGLVGSTEWVEENLKLVMDRAVACLNVDMSVEGGYSIRTKANPTLYRAVYEAAKKIPNPDPEEVAQGRITVYDTWLNSFPDEDSPITNETVPRIQDPDSGSDYATFIFFAGVPIMDIRYTNEEVEKRNVSSHPLYHTLYETFYAVDTLVDPGFEFHASISRLWAEVARVLAEEELLPLDVQDYAAYIEMAANTLNASYGATLRQHNITMNYLDQAVMEFSTSAKEFHQQLQQTDLTNVLAVRAVNDQLMQVERALLQPEGQPLSPSLRHVVFAPSSLDSYSDATFGGLVDLINTATDSESWSQVQKQLSYITYYIESASLVLKPVL